MLLFLRRKWEPGTGLGLLVPRNGGGVQCIQNS